MQYCSQCKSVYPADMLFCPLHGAPLEPRYQLVPGMIVREKYGILEEIGAGGMGQVFRVKDLDFAYGRNQSAMKIPSALLAGDASFVKRFRDEAAKARILDHPNVVRIEHIDRTESGAPFLVMELVEGKSLRWWMEHPVPLGRRDAVRIVREVARALEAAHAAGLVHCDIKPENILSVGRDAPVPLKVTDFGLAKATEALLEKVTRLQAATSWGSGMVVGTPEYMSPEQKLGRAKTALENLPRELPGSRNAETHAAGSPEKMAQTATASGRQLWRRRAVIAELWPALKAYARPFLFVAFILLAIANHFDWGYDTPEYFGAFLLIIVTALIDLVRNLRKESAWPGRLRGLGRALFVVSVASAVTKVFYFFYIAPWVLWGVSSVSGLLLLLDHWRESRRMRAAGHVRSQPAGTPRPPYRMRLLAGSIFTALLLALTYEISPAGNVTLYRIRAAMGDAGAMYHLGKFYEFGSSGLRKDEEQSVFWRRKAAEAGDKGSMRWLGEAYEDGRCGLPKDNDLAATWYRKAADHGDSAAEEALQRLGR